MSSQGVRIMKPLEDDFIPEPAKVFLEKKSASAFVLILSVLFSSISAAFAVIVFTQAHF
jgi:hypothetical protein